MYFAFFVHSPSLAHSAHFSCLSSQLASSVHWLHALGQNRATSSTFEHSPKPAQTSQRGCKSSHLLVFLIVPAQLAGHSSFIYTSLRRHSPSSFQTGHRSCLSQSFPSAEHSCAFTVKKDTKKQNTTIK